MPLLLYFFLFFLAALPLATAQTSRTVDTVLCMRFENGTAENATLHAGHTYVFADCHMVDVNVTMRVLDTGGDGGVGLVLRNVTMTRGFLNVIGVTMLPSMPYSIANFDVLVDNCTLATTWGAVNFIVGGAVANTTVLVTNGSDLSATHGAVLGFMSRRGVPRSSAMTVENTSVTLVGSKARSVMPASTPVELLDVETESACSIAFHQDRTSVALHIRNVSLVTRQQSQMSAVVTGANSRALVAMAAVVGHGTSTMEGVVIWLETHATAHCSAGRASAVAAWWAEGGPSVSLSLRGVRISLAVHAAATALTTADGAGPVATAAFVAFDGATVTATNTSMHLTGNSQATASASRNATAVVVLGGVAEHGNATLAVSDIDIGVAGTSSATASITGGAAKAGGIYAIGFGAYGFAHVSVLRAVVVVQGQCTVFGSLASNLGTCLTLLSVASCLPDSHATATDLSISILDRTTVFFDGSGSDPDGNFIMSVAAYGERSTTDVTDLTVRLDHSYVLLQLSNDFADYGAALSLIALKRDAALLATRVAFAATNSSTIALTAAGDNFDLSGILSVVGGEDIRSMVVDQATFLLADQASAALSVSGDDSTSCGVMALVSGEDPVAFNVSRTRFTFRNGATATAVLGDSDSGDLAVGGVAFEESPNVYLNDVGFDCDDASLSADGQSQDVIGVAAFGIVSTGTGLRAEGLSFVSHRCQLKTSMTRSDSFRQVAFGAILRCNPPQSVVLSNVTFAARDSTATVTATDDAQDCVAGGIHVRSSPGAVAISRLNISAINSTVTSSTTHSDSNWHCAMCVQARDSGLVTISNFSILAQASTVAATSTGRSEPMQAMSILAFDTSVDLRVADGWIYVTNGSTVLASSDGNGADYMQSLGIMAHRGSVTVDRVILKADSGSRCEVHGGDNTDHMVALGAFTKQGSMTIRDSGFYAVNSTILAHSYGTDSTELVSLGVINTRADVALENVTFAAVEQSNVSVIMPADDGNTKALLGVVHDLDSTTSTMVRNCVFLADHSTAAIRAGDESGPAALVGATARGSDFIRMTVANTTFIARHSHLSMTVTFAAKAAQFGSAIVGFLAGRKGTLVVANTTTIFVDNTTINVFAARPDRVVAVAALAANEADSILRVDPTASFQLYLRSTRINVTAVSAPNAMIVFGIVADGGGSNEARVDLQGRVSMVAIASDAVLAAANTAPRSVICAVLARGAFASVVAPPAGRPAAAIQGCRSIFNADVGNTIDQVAAADSGTIVNASRFNVSVGSHVTAFARCIDEFPPPPLPNVTVPEIDIVPAPLPQLRTASHTPSAMTPSLSLSQTLSVSMSATQSGTSSPATASLTPSRATTTTTGSTSVTRTVSATLSRGSRSASVASRSPSSSRTDSLSAHSEQALVTNTLRVTGTATRGSATGTGPRAVTPHYPPSPTAFVVTTTPTVVPPTAAPRRNEEVADAAENTAVGVTTVAAMANPAVASQAGKLAAVRALATCGGTREVQPPEQSGHPTGLALSSVSPSNEAVALHAGAVVADVALTVGVSCVLGLVVGSGRFIAMRRRATKARACRPEDRIKRAVDDELKEAPSFLGALAWARFPGAAVFIVEYFTGFVVASAVVVATKAPGGLAMTAVVALGFFFAVGPIVVCGYLFATRFRRCFEFKPNPPSAKSVASAGPVRRVVRWLFRPHSEWFPIDRPVQEERPSDAGNMNDDAMDDLLLGLHRPVKSAKYEPLADSATLKRYHKHFGLAFDGYAGRAPWFLLVESLVLNTGTSVALALAAVTECRAATYVALAAYGLHLILLFVLRPYTMRAEAIGQTLSVLCQAVSVTLATVDQAQGDGNVADGGSGEATGMRAAAEDLATASAFVVSLFAFLDIGQSVYLQIRKQRAAKRAEEAASRAQAESMGLLSIPQSAPPPPPPPADGEGGLDDLLGVEELAPIPPPPPPKAAPAGPTPLELERARAAAAAAEEAADRAAKFAHWQRLREQADRLVSELYASRATSDDPANSLLATVGTGGNGGRSSFLMAGGALPPPPPRRNRATDNDDNDATDDDEAPKASPLGSFAAAPGASAAHNPQLMSRVEAAAVSTPAPVTTTSTADNDHDDSLDSLLGD